MTIYRKDGGILRVGGKIARDAACCNACYEVCASCEDEQAPPAAKVVFSWDDWLCNDCELYNGTYIANVFGCGPDTNDACYFAANGHHRYDIGAVWRAPRILPVEPVVTGCFYTLGQIQLQAGIGRAWGTLDWYLTGSIWLDIPTYPDIYFIYRAFWFTAIDSSYRPNCKTIPVTPLSFVQRSIIASGSCYTGDAYDVAAVNRCDATTATFEFGTVL